MKKDLVIIGASGFGTEVLWLAREMAEWNVLGFADDNVSLKGTQKDGYPVLGTVDELIAEGAQGRYFHCAIGDNGARAKLAAKLEGAGLRAATLIHPTAVIDEPTVKVGEGCYLGANCVIAPEASVGRHVIVNLLTCVGHHAQVGDFAQLCPGAKVTGACVLKVGSYLGSNASLHPGVTVGDYASVGANSFAVREVEAYTTVMGVPARPVHKRKAPKD